MRALILTLFSLGGCVYIGGINHRPEGDITVQSQSAKLEVQGWVTLEAGASDPDGDELTYEWRVAVVDEEGNKLSLTAPSPSGSDGVNFTTQPAAVIWTGATLSLNRLPLRGTYTASLRIIDEKGADRLVSRTLTVKNQPPGNIKLLLTADPSYRDDDQVPDIKGSYPAHAHYLVRVSENDVEDVERDLVCGKKAKVAWTLDHGAKQSPEYALVKTCQGNEVLDRLRFRYATPTAAKPVTLTIRADVDDGHGGKGQGTLTVSLAPNRPPCILGSDPSFKDALSLALLGGSQHSFAVTSLSDDVQVITTYQWSVRDAGENTYTVLPGQAGASFLMPAWFRLPGDQFQLRVLVKDEQNPFADCSVDTGLCAVSSSLPAGCYQGITWKVSML